jgi:predicted MFS family arabinose efflux permease
MGVFWLDNYDRKHALVVFSTGFALCTLACGFANSYELMVAARSCAGFFGGIIGTVILSIVGDIIPIERRGTAMGIVTTSFSLATVIGVPLGLLLANNYNWQMPFLVLGTLSAVITIITFVVIPTIRTHLDNKITAKNLGIAHIKSLVFSNTSRMSALFIMLILSMGQFSVVPFISPHMITNVGFLEKELPNIYFFGGIGSFILMPVIGRLSDWYGKKIMFTIVGTGAVLIAIVLTHLSYIHFWLAICVTTLFFVFSGGRMIPLTALVSSTIPSQERGSFMSMSASLQQIGAALAAWLSGQIVFMNAAGHLANFEFMGWFSAGCGILGLILIWKLKGQY